MQLFFYLHFITLLLVLDLVLCLVFFIVDSMAVMWYNIWRVRMDKNKQMLHHKTLPVCPDKGNPQTSHCGESRRIGEAG